MVSEVGSEGGEPQEMTGPGMERGTHTVSPTCSSLPWVSSWIPNCSFCVLSSLAFFGIWKGFVLSGERFHPFWFKVSPLVSTQLFSGVCKSEGDRANWNPIICFIPFGIWARTPATFLGFQENVRKRDPGHLNALRAALPQGLWQVHVWKLWTLTCSFLFPLTCSFLTKWAEPTKSNPELSWPLQGTFNLPKLVFLKIKLENCGSKILFYLIYYF